MGDVPAFGITVSAPWWWYLGHGKDLENRNAKDAKACIVHVGARIAITSSASHPFVLRGKFARRPYMDRHGKPNMDAFADVVSTMRALKHLVPTVSPPEYEELASKAGHWVATARLAGVLSPVMAHGRPWHSRKSWALLLADIEVLEKPEPCSGGKGLFPFARHTCGRPIALKAKCKCLFFPGGTS